MGKPHPIELRERVIAFVEEGQLHLLKKATATVQRHLIFAFRRGL